MTMLSHESMEMNGNPIDILEQIAADNEWLFDRNGEEEINVSFPGRWGDYHITLSWRADIETLHLSAALELKVPLARRAEVCTALSLINEQLWIGHFDLWSDEGQVLFRYGLLLSGQSSASSEQCQTIVHVAVDACDRFYPAFQYIIWAGKSAREAVAAAAFETVGTA